SSQICPARGSKSPWSRALQPIPGASQNDSPPVTTSPHALPAPTPSPTEISNVPHPHHPDSPLPSFRYEPLGDRRQPGCGYGDSRQERSYHGDSATDIVLSCAAASAPQQIAPRLPAGQSHAMRLDEMPLSVRSPIR